ncbi:hypothetical protein [Mycobacterium simiae]|nr:hypothetical protein [Mycobacterium simiae]
MWREKRLRIELPPNGRLYVVFRVSARIGLPPEEPEKKPKRKPED